MITYLNLKTNHGTETVDQADRNDFETTKAFRTHVRELRREYSLAGMNVYSSSRSSKEWRNRQL